MWLFQWFLSPDVGQLSLVPIVAVPPFAFVPQFALVPVPSTFALHPRLFNVRVDRQASGDGSEGSKEKMKRIKKPYLFDFRVSIGQ